MKLNKIEKIIKKTELECEVTEITLLSEEEYKKYKHLIPVTDGWWWLRSPPYGANGLAVVGNAGGLTYAGYGHTGGGGVRPALWIEAESLESGEEIELNGDTWTVLDYVDGKAYALADKIIDHRRFDGESNIWEQSELKKWLEEWKESWTE